MESAWRMCIYLVMLVVGLSGLILLLAIHATVHVYLAAAIGWVSFILIIVSFLQLSREWVSPRDWLQIFSLVFLIGGIRLAYLSCADTGISTDFYVGLVICLLGVLGLALPHLKRPS